MMAWLPWPISWGDITYLVRSSWSDLVGTDFSQIKYSDINPSLYIGAGILVMLVLKLVMPRILSALFGRKKYSQKVSGHFISGKYKEGFLAGIFLFLPKLALIVPLVAILLTIADPFVASIREEKEYVEARIRIDVRDVSGSMSFKFNNTTKSKAEIAMNAHLKFLEMRKGKGDRASFWVFSDNPYIIQDFIVDDEVYRQQVYDAPWEMGPGVSDDYNWELYAIPKSRYAKVDGEGGTELAGTLQALNKYFEEDEAKQKTAPGYRPVAGKSVLIITDADISDVSATRLEVEKLRSKKIVLYIIFIDTIRPPPSPSPEDEGSGSVYQNPGQPSNVHLYALPGQSDNTNPLLEEIIKNGGKYFPVSSPDSILNAFREIDRLEKNKFQIEKIVFKTPVFYKFIFISILALLFIIPTGSFFKIFQHP